MRITSKGQVTIPQEIREKFGFMPFTEIDFEITPLGVLLKKSPKSNLLGEKILQNMRGSADVKIRADEIMALTRG